MRMRITTCLLACLGLVGFAPPLLAQSDNPDQVPEVDRKYQLLREDEDWTFLRNPDLRQDFWDRVKYVPLRHDANDWYLTVAGEAREVWEQIGNDNWGQQPYMNGYLNERYMLSSANTYARSSS